MRPTADKAVTEMASFAREHLGPACEQVLSSPGVQARVYSSVQAGAELEDALLREVHHAAKGDRLVAEEFSAYLSNELLELSHGAPPAGTRNLLETSDLAQSVFEDIWPQLAGLEFKTRRQFRAFLRQRVHWKVRDRLRGLRVGSRREDLRVAPPPEALAAEGKEDVPLQFLEALEEKELLDSILARLPKRERRILVLRRSGRSFEEIARELGMKVKTTRNVFYKALEKARKLAG